MDGLSHVLDGQKIAFHVGLPWESPFQLVPAELLMYRDPTCSAQYAGVFDFHILPRPLRPISRFSFGKTPAMVGKSLDEICEIATHVAARMLEQPQPGSRIEVILVPLFDQSYHFAAVLCR